MHQAFELGVGEEGATSLRAGIGEKDAASPGVKILQMREKNPECVIFCVNGSLWV